jgi:predicted permease
MWTDLMFALRRIRLEPILCLTIVAGWTVALGTSTAAFSLVKAVLFRTPGVEAPESVWRIVAAPTSSPNWTDDELRSIQRATTRLSVAGYVVDKVGYVMDGSAATQSISTTAVSGNFFALLGGRVVKGRPLVESDDAAGAAPVAVVSHSFWKTVLAASDTAVGQTIRLNGDAFTVIGIANPTFHGPNVRTPPAVWISLTAYREAWHGRPGAAFDRDAIPVQLLARIAADSSVAQAEAEVSGITNALPEGGRQNVKAARRLRPLVETRSEPALIVMVVAVMGTVAVVVMLAAANAANLLLASGIKRTKEFGVRLALGARAFHIARQLFVESLLLAVLGGAGGLWVATSLLTAVPGMLSLTWVDTSLDRSSYAWLIALITFVAVAAGLAPVRYGWRTDLLPVTKDSHQPALQLMRTGRLRSLLVATQATTSVVLLVITGLLMRSMISARSFDSGFDIDHVLTVSVDFGPRFDTSRAGDFWAAALDRVRSIPGVRGAALVQYAPFTRGFPMQYLPTGQGLYRNEVSADYFDVVGLSILAGRTFDATESGASAPVAVISESLAREFWPAGETLGTDLSRVPNQPKATIVGIVRDSVIRLRYHAAHAVYVPPSRATAAAMQMVVAADEPYAAAGVVRSAIGSIDQGSRGTVTVVRDAWNVEQATPVALASFASVLSVVTVILAVGGLAGVTAFAAAQRRGEVGVRLALGATTSSIVRTLMSESLTPVMYGTGVGLGVAWVIGGLIQGRLYAVSAYDPLVAASAASIMLVTALLTTLLVVRPAASVNPVALLRRA